MSNFALDLRRAFLASLREGEGQALSAAVEAAKPAGAGLFLVGGPVRDLVLRRASADVDIAVEGDVDALAGELESSGYRVVRHGRFGTATLRGAGFSIDFARTRRETYARPGALPDVEPAGIAEDLARRDFSVNAIALDLVSAEAELIDPYAGLKDIRSRLLRVLHDRSFQDDATRMLRGCRYAARLGFQVEPVTAGLIRRDLSFLDTVSGARLRRELVLIFREEAAVAALEKAQAFGILAAIHPSLRLQRRDGGAWRRALAEDRHASLDEFGFCMLLQGLSSETVGSLTARLHLTGRIEAALLDLVRLHALSDNLDRPGFEPMDAVDMLDAFAPAAIWAFALRGGGRVRDRCLAYLRQWRRVRSRLDGVELQRLGLREGPEVGRALRRLRAAHLAGLVRTKDEEIALVRREFAPEGGA